MDRESLDALVSQAVTVINDPAATTDQKIAALFQIIQVKILGA